MQSYEKMYFDSIFFAIRKIVINFAKLKKLAGTAPVASRYSSRFLNNHIKIYSTPAHALFIASVSRCD